MKNKSFVLINIYGVLVVLNIFVIIINNYYYETELNTKVISQTYINNKYNEYLYSLHTIVL